MDSGCGREEVAWLGEFALYGLLCTIRRAPVMHLLNLEAETISRGLHPLTCRPDLVRLEPGPKLRNWRAAQDVRRCCRTYRMRAAAAL